MILIHICWLQYNKLYTFACRWSLYAHFETCFVPHIGNDHWPCRGKFLCEPTGILFYALTSANCPQFESSISQTNEALHFCTFRPNWTYITLYLFILQNFNMYTYVFGNIIIIYIFLNHIYIQMSTIILSISDLETRLLCGLWFNIIQNICLMPVYVY